MINKYKKKNNDSSIQGLKESISKLDLVVDNNRDNKNYQEYSICCDNKRNNKKYIGLTFVGNNETNQSILLLKDKPYILNYYISLSINKNIDVNNNNYFALFGIKQQNDSNTLKIINGSKVYFESDENENKITISNTLLFCNNKMNNELFGFAHIDENCMMSMDSYLKILNV